MQHAAPDRSIEGLIGALGTASLGDTVLREARMIADIDEIFGFRIDNECDDPVPLVSAGCRGSAHSRASRYSASFHRLDPMLGRMRTAARGSAQSDAITARDIADTRYRSECFDRVGLRAKIGFVRRGAHGLYMMNFYCAQDRQLETLTERLAAFATLALPILERHSDLVADDVRIPLHELVRRRLVRAHPDLTHRESEVCSRTIIGMSSEAIALALGVSQATILTYRRRAYQRCDLSSAMQFIPDIINP